MSTTEKRHDIIADTLTIREMDVILDGLTLVAISKMPDETRQLARDVRRLIGEASCTAVRNEYAGDYDYPDDAE